MAKALEQDERHKMMLDEIFIGIGACVNLAESKAKRGVPIDKVFADLRDYIAMLREA